jgi:hypothetical protein
MRHGLLITLSHPLSASTRCAGLSRLSQGEFFDAAVQTAEENEGFNNSYKAAIQYFLTCDNQLVVTLLTYAFHALLVSFCEDGNNEAENIKTKILFLEAVHVIPPLGLSNYYNQNDIEWSQLQLPQTFTPSDPSTESTVDSSTVDEESWKKKRHGLHMKKLASNGLFNPDYLSVGMLNALNVSVTNQLTLRTDHFLSFFCIMLTNPQKYSLTAIQVCCISPLFPVAV